MSARDEALPAPETEPGAAAAPDAARLLAAGVPALAFVALAAWSFGKWTDAHIDFGSQLYTAWRLTEGEALYRDIALRNGPLSPHVNALWFSLFGVSLRTLVWCNLAILTALCVSLFALLERACGRLAAGLSVLVFLCVFAFSQYLPIANYNFVTPYQHEQTHALLLSFAMLGCFSRLLRGGAAAWSLGAGLCLGAVYLTKAELFVPAAASAQLGTVAAGWVRTDGARCAGRLALGTLVLPLAFLFALAGQIGVVDAVLGVMGNWNHLGGALLTDAFYRRGAGLDDPAGNFRHMLRIALGIAVFAAAAHGLDRFAPARFARPAAGVAAGGGVFALLVAWPQLVPWTDLARALPLAMGVAGAALCAAAFRHRGDRERFAGETLLAMWAIYALGLLGKMILHARFTHYGFALAMPATLLLVALLSGRTAGAMGWGPLARGVSIGAVLAGAVFFLRASDAIYERRDFALGRGADAITVDAPEVNPRGPVLAAALRRLEAISTPDDTLLVLPEGVILNYWLRREAPSRYLLFLPTELAAFGEDAILAELRADPPDLVALVHREHREFGVGPFGTDPANGEALLDWVQDHYARVARFGAEPFRGRGFGVVILRRVEAAPGPGSAAHSLR